MDLFAVSRRAKFNLPLVDFPLACLSGVSGENLISATGSRLLADSWVSKYCITEI